MSFRHTTADFLQSSDYISDYESENASQRGDDRSEISLSELHPLKDPELVAKPSSKPTFPAYGQAKSVLDNEQRRAHNAANRQQLLGLDAFDRHRKLVNDYLQYYGGSWSDFKRDESTDRRDIDVIREHGRFLWSEKDEPATWSERLAKRYWDKLFKEYCLVDLSRYKENKFGMRWRLEREVISGKGQFFCGNVRCSAGKESRLRSWEVNFAYKERGQRRNALVKLRLCPECSDKLNYKYKRRDVTGQTVGSEYTGHEAPESVTEESTGEDAADAPAEKRMRPAPDETKVWRNVAAISASQSSAPKTQEEEFDEYFSDMLL